jgi:hypothetical protein
MENINKSQGLPTYKDQVQAQRFPHLHHPPQTAGAPDSSGLLPPIAILTAELVDEEAETDDRLSKRNQQDDRRRCVKMAVLAVIIAAVVGGAATGITCALGQCSTTTTMDYCGNGTVGNGICEESTATSFICCSKHGWCGITVAHCTDTPAGDACGDARIGMASVPTRVCAARPLAIVAWAPNFVVMKQSNRRSLFAAMAPRALASVKTRCCAAQRTSFVALERTIVATHNSWLYNEPCRRKST